MKENIEDYRRNGFINLDEYMLNNPEGMVYPFYIDGYDEKNFWTRVKKDEEEKYIYVKPRELEYTNNEYNVISELLYEQIMKQVGIKTVDFDIANYDGNLATISDNLLDKYGKNEFLINASAVSK